MPARTLRQCSARGKDDHDRTHVHRWKHPHGGEASRQFRDIHTAAAHVMIGALSNEAAGRVELGLEPGFPFF